MAGIFFIIMEKVFISHESYMHSTAKNLVADALIKSEQNADICGKCSFSNLTWFKNWGVFTELPFYEKDDICYFELSEAIKYIDRSVNKNNHQFVFDSKIDRGNILFVPDIVIFQKGCISKIIEVVHKNEIPEWKINKIKSVFRNQVDLYTIRANYILSQIDGNIENAKFTKIL